VQRFTLEFINAARPCRRTPGNWWFASETYVAGQRAYLYRAIDQHGQVIDVLVSARRDLAAARRSFARALRAGAVPGEVTTDRAPPYRGFSPMRGLKRHQSARIVVQTEIVHASRIWTVRRPQLGRAAR